MKQLDSLVKWYVKRTGMVFREEVPVVYESKLPPEFIITKHAEERLKERFACRPDKRMKLTVKAWESQEKVNPQYIQEKKMMGYKKSQLRYFQGYIWVFAQRFNNLTGLSQKRLITVYNPNIRSLN